jgi:hypothetical protein
MRQEAASLAAKERKEGKETSRRKGQETKKCDLNAKKRVSANGILS